MAILRKQPQPADVFHIVCA